MQGNKNDHHDEIVPCRLEVSAWHEPECTHDCLTKSKLEIEEYKRSNMGATLLVSNLIPLTSYSCFRYDKLENIPTAGTDFEHSKYFKRYDFVAHDFERDLNFKDLSTDVVAAFRCKKALVQEMNY